MDETARKFTEKMTKHTAAPAEPSKKAPAVRLATGNEAAPLAAARAFIRRAQQNYLANSILEAVNSSFPSTFLQVPVAVTAFTSLQMLLWNPLLTSF